MSYERFAVPTPIRERNYDEASSKSTLLGAREVGAFHLPFQVWHDRVPTAAFDMQASRSEQSMGGCQCFFTSLTSLR